MDQDEKGLSEYICIAEESKKQMEEAPEGRISPENVNVYHTLIATELMAESARKRKRKSRLSSEKRFIQRKMRLTDSLSL